MMSQQDRDDFFIGYAQQLPTRIKTFLFCLIPSLVIAVISLGVIMPLVHYQFPESDFTRFRDYQGMVLAKPVPHLVIPRPGNTRSGEPFSRYFMMGTIKEGVTPKLLEFDGQWVKFRALPIFRDHATTLAVSRRVEPEAIEPLVEIPVPREGESLGDFTLRGEVVDSKCYLGVMKPGHTKTHRKCAARCISGGIPPALRVINENGDLMSFLMVDRQDNPVNSRVLDLVADFVEVTGEVMRYNDLMVLRADPNEYRLVFRENLISALDSLDSTQNSSPLLRTRLPGLWSSAKVSVSTGGRSI